MSTRWYMTTGRRGEATLEHRRADGFVDLTLVPSEFGLYVVGPGEYAIPWKEIEELTSAIRACANVGRSSGWVPNETGAAEQLRVTIAVIENNGHRFVPRGGKGWICPRCKLVTDDFPSLYAEPCPGGNDA